MRAAVLLVAALVVAVPVQAQVKAGPEFRVNPQTAGHQYAPAVAALPGGGFVVAWTDSTTSPSNALFARRYNLFGAPEGAVFQVNSYTFAQGGYSLGLASNPRGEFVAAWTGNEPTSSYSEVLARRFDPQGRARGREFLVNTATIGPQLAEDVAMAPGGEFVVAWTSFSSGFDALGRRYDAGGVARGGEFAISSVTTLFQGLPSVGMADDGSFVATYVGYGGADGYGLFARRFDSQGRALGSEFRPNTNTSAATVQVEVRVAPDRTFVVSWAQYTDGPSDTGAIVRRFDAGGTALGPELRIDSGGRASYPRTAFDASGRFVVVWAHSATGVTDTEVRARRFDAQGVPLGPEFRVNTSSTGNHQRPVVASDRVGNFVVTWTSGSQADSKEVYGQRFGGLQPAGVELEDGNSNGVLEMSESATLRTYWRNVSGAAQTFTGNSSNVAAPPGLTLTVSPQADYGTLPDESVFGCLTCFTVTPSGTRPAGHVDASFRETLAPLELGQAQNWTLHVGGSFVDVPVASPYYASIETLMHRGITSGCGNGVYCSGASTTREQMAVFVLSAKEGQGYKPPPCTAPVFNDVPASSPFCPYVEELVRRGVTSGCGGGNYCPGSPVSREQMAVFVLRTWDPALNPIPCMTPLFNDVPASSPFCRWVEDMARRGITSGCGGGNFCPTQPVTREQMAVFISKGFNLKLYEP